ncbi:MAG: hypothetical protein U0K48_06000 [Bacilli bacterium]|nr:hypothetical protein [Bacilli bacterium]
MLVSKIMQVLSNLFGLNKKISANDIAIKDNNGKAETLSNYLSFGFASMHTNFAYKIFDSETIVTGWEEPISYGDIVADISNNRIVIKNTKLLEISGYTAGALNGLIEYSLKESDSNRSLISSEGRVLFQGFGVGNNYWSLPLKTCIVELEPSKKYYFQLIVNGYRNQSFEMNNGFGKYATSIQAKKLK